MKRFLPAFVLLAFIAAFALTTTTSCNKNRESKVIVSVTDSLGEPFPSLVLIYCSEPDCVVEDSASTGLDGQAEFTFPNPGILLVDVQVGTTVYEGGFVELEPGETVEKPVELPL